MKTTNLFLTLVSLSIPLFAADLPPDAAALKGKRDAKIVEINQLYANELEKIQKLAMKNGNLEAATAIEQEIAAARSLKSDNGPVLNKKNTLDGSWVVQAGARAMERTFAGGFMIDQLGMKHTYTQSGDTLTIKWDGGWEKLVIDKTKPDVMQGTNAVGQTFVYLRKK